MEEVKAEEKMGEEWGWEEEERKWINGRAEGGKRRKGEEDLQEIKGKEDTEGGGAIE